ncbi:hypothetical protein GCM10011390_09850 [Aureimonas endophytica]|uniref:Sel1 repeat-containing protein n=1 Tax=Aureimonas endophytica TaxID=2027858 RepID=A0A916ZF52_9HYPH|nr:sel1 repeat family protein [Aureimonas endophytica]GGD93130.1 hypothetical protein GCM10011390_09850 [Aureimonas endophytica]
MARFDFSEMTSGGIGAKLQTGAGVLFEMGMRAASGRDGAIDLVAAHMYFNLADRQGDERAAYHRQDIAEQMSKLEIGRALRAARDWLATH